MYERSVSVPAGLTRRIALSILRRGTPQACVLFTCRVVSLKIEVKDKSAPNINNRGEIPTGSTPAYDVVAGCTRHSHSIVPGGFDVTS